ncbi:MAG: divalent cation tolerance protein CutA [Candidatus Diapherotrites archaeon]
MKKIFLIYSTFPSKKEAEKCVLRLLEKKLIACANFFESKSNYFWENRVVKEKEIICFMKTSRQKMKEAVLFLENIHPYKVPCVLFYEVKSAEKYYLWLKKALL